MYKCLKVEKSNNLCVMIGQWKISRQTETYRFLILALANLLFLGVFVCVSSRY